MEDVYKLLAQQGDLAEAYAKQKKERKLEKNREEKERQRRVHNLIVKEMLKIIEK